MVPAAPPAAKNVRATSCPPPISANAPYVLAPRLSARAFCLVVGVGSDMVDAPNLVHREGVAEHGPAALGSFSSRFVLDDVPMLDEDSFLDPQDVRSDPVRRRAEPR